MKKYNKTDLNKLNIIQKQVDVLVKNNVQFIKIICGKCGKDHPLIESYLCLECHVRFCKNCAKEHFK
jgi:hypothetical protein